MTWAAYDMLINHGAVLGNSYVEFHRAVRVPFPEARGHYWRILMNHRWRLRMPTTAARAAPHRHQNQPKRKEPLPAP